MLLVFIVSRIVNSILKPRVSSPIPGAYKVSFSILTLTFVPSGKTVSKCASRATVCFPSDPRRSPKTFPSESIQTESIPKSL